MDITANPAHSESSTLASSTVLNSWKEIAGYLDRGVRTVQRWEKDLAFPIRRPRGKSRSAVIALRTDVDQWLKSRPLTKIEDQAITTASPGSEVASLHLSRAVLESRVLRSDIAQSRHELQEVIVKLTKTLRGLVLTEGTGVLPPSGPSRSA